MPTQEKLQVMLPVALCYRGKTFFNFDFSNRMSIKDKRGPCPFRDYWRSPWPYQYHLTDTQTHRLLACGHPHRHCPRNRLF